MALTSEQMVAALAARRMLEDEQLQAVFTDIQQQCIARAMFLTEAMEREDNRQRVVAIDWIRQEIAARAQLPEADAQATALARSLE